MSKAAKSFRTDSILGNLPPERQEQIAEWILKCPEGDRLEHARTQLAADGVKVARSTVGDWFRGWQLRQDVSSWDSFVSNYEERVMRRDPTLTPEQAREFGQTLFTMRAVLQENGAEWREMEKLQLARESAQTKGRQKDEEIALGKRRVSLLERNAARAKEKLTAVAASGGLSAEALKQIEQAAKILS